jgi:hypothetical protein
MGLVEDRGRVRNTPSARATIGGRTARVVVSWLAWSACLVVVGGLAVPPAGAELSSVPGPGVAVTGPYSDPGDVLAVASVGDTVYIGGDFSAAAQRTGPGVGLSRATGRSDPSFAEVGFAANQTPPGGASDGVVRAVVRDGAGGWFVGGLFNTVGGLPRRNLAHILSDGRVDPRFAPKPDGGVDELARSGRVVYAAGGFGRIGGRRRVGLAAVDAATGRGTGWDPKWSFLGGGQESIDALAATGRRVYVGGGFERIGGKKRSSLAALDARTGRATQWDPKLETSFNGVVDALAVSGRTVYVGGGLHRAGGKARHNLAAFDAASGRVTSWNPGSVGGVDALAVAGSTVYVGGTFRSIGGRPRHRLAAVKASTGAATNWHPDPNGPVDSLAVSGSTVYAGGTFRSIAGQARHHLAALDAATGRATAWNPNPNRGDRTVNGVVDALAVSGSTVYAGGNFLSIGAQPRTNLAAFDASTGEVTDWNPNPYPPPPTGRVSGLALSGSTVFAGGDFSSVGGQPRDSFATLDASTGAATVATPNVGCCVDALAASGSTLYAADGSNGLMALNLDQSARTDWRVYYNGRINALAVAGSNLYVAGSFKSIDGRPRNGFAALNASTGDVTDWDPHAQTTASDQGGHALAVSGSTIFVAGAFSSIGGQPRNQLAALDATTANATDWNPNPTSPPGYTSVVDALAVSGPNVYVGGSFDSINGQPRRNVAALDATTGAATSWNPNPDPRTCCPTTFAISGSALIVGGSFDRIGPVTAPRIAVFTTP